MDTEEAINYRQQLKQIQEALLVCSDGPEKDELLSLKASIEELLELTSDGIQSGNDECNEFSTSTVEDRSSNSVSKNDKLEDEFAAFMAEMEKEGAVNVRSGVDVTNIEGKKCKAPHTHQWGNIAYHNAMICSVLPDSNEELKVKVLFTNPTHQEMLPCPFYFDSDCKFSEDQCRYSHGETVLYSSLQEYIEPNFQLLSKGSSVLVKESNNLWSRGKIVDLYDEKCLVKLESNSKEFEANLEHIFPLQNDINSSDEESGNCSDNVEFDQNEIINKSLLITPDSQAMGDWEKYTKGMGSKLMIKMGYIIGTGLGKTAEGRVNPVSAVIFPSGKSLDYCMKLREQAGGDKDLFSAEKKMKRLQKRQEIRSKREYERKKKQLKKQDVFTFINKTMQQENSNKDLRKEKDNLKQETSRNLNIKSVQIEKEIKEAERDLENIKASLSRQTNVTSDVYKSLKGKFYQKQTDLKNFEQQAQIIKNEQNLRDNKKKMTIF